MEGVAVVVIAHVIGTSTNGGDSIVAYLTDAGHQVGKTLNDADEGYMKKCLADPNYLTEKTSSHRYK